ncbi:EF-hand domain-containing protein [Crocosphaera sp. XPORK-15E]|uniref:EF-hand domain-containing protein n=1 Tax=Crocosphaera sp. XPORK-15E TaxID=3110247 RepID=UPI002B20D420|nr:EF-hand domain-containing protein [Crocosphaera sp. XPORK-15E]MEA5533985.1 EF-hand domain-containing protein [Crocosphaera sp. XPORK-15E]
MLSQLRQKKLTHLFDILDLNHDGVLSPEDFSQAINEITNLRGWKLGSPEYEELHFFWTGFSSRLQVWSDRNGDGKITQAEWLWYLEQMLDEFKAYYIKQGLINITLKSMDFSQDDKISLDEFKRFYQIYKIADQEANQTFGKLDLNQDGYLTKDELNILLNEFFYSEDFEAPGNWFWGNY